MPGKAKRTTLRSSTGTKLYAVRTAAGAFADIQTYKNAHGADLQKKSKAELAAKPAAAKPMASKPMAAKPAAAKPMAKPMAAKTKVTTKVVAKGKPKPLAKAKKK